MQTNECRQMFCAVCGRTTNSVRQGVLACEGCKKFFLRHRGELGLLMCLTGLNACTDFTGAQGRPFCPACRLKRCFAVGMRIKGRRNKQTSSAANAEPNEMVEEDEQQDQDTNEASQLTGPGNIDAINAENVIIGAVRAHACLNDLLIMKSIVDKNGNECDVSTVWQKAMEFFSSAAYTVLAFVKKLPAYISLSVNDRCLLFGKAFLPIVQCHRLVPPSDRKPRLFNLDDISLGQFLYFYPFFIPSVNEFDEIAAVTSEWKPSVVEQALLETFIFYQITDGHNLESSTKISEICYLINLSLKAYLSSRGDNKQEQNTTHFYKVYSMLKSSAANFGDLLKHFSRARPIGVPENRIFIEITEILSTGTTLFHFISSS